MPATVTGSPLSLRHIAAAVLIAMIVPAGAFGSPVVFAMMLCTMLVSLTVPNRSIHIKRGILMAGFHPLGILTVLTLLMWLPGILVSPTPVESIKTWGKIALVIMIAVYLWSVLDRHAALQSLTQKILVGSLTVILLFTVLAIHLYPEIIYFLRHATEPWGRYEAFASTLVCIIPIFAWFTWKFQDWQRWAALLSIGLALHMMIGTDSRSAMAGLALSCTIGAGLLAFQYKKLRIALAIIVFIVFALVAWILSKHAGHGGLKGPLNLPFWLIDYHRQCIWHFVGSRIPEAFWFGHGLNAIAHIPGADQNAPGLSVALIPSHPHNWILEIFFETGIFGIAGVIAILASIMLNDAKRFLKNKDARALTRLTMCIAFWSSSCFNFSIWAPWWGVTFLSLFALLSARPEISTGKNAKMLFAVTEGFAFLSHRLPMARAAKACDFDVDVICAPGDKTEEIESHDISVHHWPMKRSGTNPYKEFLSLNALRKTYEHEQPALVHHVAIKPVLYGAIAAQLANIPMVVNAMIGLGFLFINQGQKISILRKLVLGILRITLNSPNARLLVQNQDDAKLFTTIGVISPARVILIPGSGVDATQYSPSPEPDLKSNDKTIVVSVVSRMLWDKGIGETVEAARILKSRGESIKIRLIGDIDSANPQCIPKTTLLAWQDEGIVEWKGPRKDIQNVWAESHIALLPSYREGMPKALLEAAACARPLITTDAPGCRSLVNDGENGFLVPIKNADAIVTAILKLAKDPELRQTMGQIARHQIETIYADPVIEKSVVELYKSLQSQQVQA